MTTTEGAQARGLATTDRVCWAVLAAAMAAAAAYILYLNRGTTFFLDELVHVYRSPELDLDYLLEPVNGHLAITIKLAYKALLETAGTNYVVFRVVHVASELLAAGLFYALVKRRVGPVVALAPTIVLLFFGSAYAHVVVPVGIGIFLCISAGLGALICLERDDRRGDVAACALLVLAVLTFTIGLAFVVGAAVSVLLREDRWRRAWIFAIPTLVYAVWWVWSQSQPAPSGEETALSNVVEIPRWLFDSLSAVTNSIAGLQYDAAGASLFGGLGWGRVLAVVALVALALRLRRGDVPSTLWVALGIVVGYWCLGALAADPELRGPDSLRYMYPGAVMVLLVAAEAARGVRFSRVGLAALFAITALAVFGNAIKLRDGAREFRAYSADAKAQFTALEVARGTVAPDFSTEYATAGTTPVGARASVYFDSADRYGALGYTVPELEEQAPEARDFADLVLTKAYELQLAPGGEEAGGACETVRPPVAGGPIVFELPRGGAALRARGAEEVPIEVGRFGDAPSVFVGDLQPGEPAELRVPADAADRPWMAGVTGAASVRVCGRA